MTKWIAGIATLATGYFLVKSSRLQQVAKEMIIRSNVRIHQFTGVKLVFAVDVTFINPTDATLKVEHPFVSIYTSVNDIEKRNPLLVSKLLNTSYTIKPNTETLFNPILVDFNLLDFGLGTSIWGIVQKILKREKVSFWIRTTAKVLNLKTIEQVQVYEIDGNAS